MHFLRRLLSKLREPPTSPTPIARPTVTISTINFSNGSELPIEEDDLVVVIGPNNVGKSRLLKSIKNASDNEPPGGFVKAVSVIKRGSAADFAAFVKQYEGRARKDSDYSVHTYDALYKVPDNPAEQWVEPGRTFGNIFVKLIGTEGRLTEGDSAKNFDPIREPPKHPIHLMYLDGDLEERISSHFRALSGRI